MTLEAVTFDFWNTLVLDVAPRAREARIDAWLGLLEDAGFAVERERLDAAFSASWDRFVQCWEADEQYTATEAAVDIVEELGYELPAELHDALVATYARHDALEPQLTHGAAECLRALKTAGVKLGIICDVGMTPSPSLREILGRFGVLHLFDHWSFSDEVGRYKPSPVIFEHALAGLGGVPPRRAAHVGDLRRTDVAGAKAMGMTAVRYKGVFDDESEGPEADIVVASHDELPAALGLAPPPNG